VFIRTAWDSAGTYQIGDGGGDAETGQQRFAPLVNCVKSATYRAIASRCA